MSIKETLTSMNKNHILTIAVVIMVVLSATPIPASIFGTTSLVGVASASTGDFEGGDDPGWEQTSDTQIVDDGYNGSKSLSTTGSGNRTYYTDTKLNSSDSFTVETLYRVNASNNNDNWWDLGVRNSTTGEEVRIVVNDNKGQRTHEYRDGSGNSRHSIDGNISGDGGTGWYQMKLRVSDGQAFVKIWDANNSEPGTWDRIIDIKSFEGELFVRGSSNNVEGRLHLDEFTIDQSPPAEESVNSEYNLSKWEARDTRLSISTNSSQNNYALVARNASVSGTGVFYTDASFDTSAENFSVTYTYSQSTNPSDGNVRVGVLGSGSDTFTVSQQHGEDNTLLQKNSGGTEYQSDIYGNFKSGAGNDTVTYKAKIVVHDGVMYAYHWVEGNGQPDKPIGVMSAPDIAAGEIWLGGHGGGDLNLRFYDMSYSKGVSTPAPADYYDLSNWSKSTKPKFIDVEDEFTGNYSIGNSKDVLKYTESKFNFSKQWTISGRYHMKSAPASGEQPRFGIKNFSSGDRIIYGPTKDKRYFQNNTDTLQTSGDGNTAWWNWKLKSTGNGEAKIKTWKAGDSEINSWNHTIGGANFTGTFFMDFDNDDSSAGPSMRHEALSFAGSAAANSGSTVDVRVTDQDGNPIENTTIEIVASKEPSVTNAQDQLEDLSDPMPTSFQNQLDGGFEPRSEWDGLNNYYVGVYTTEDIGTKPWIDNADLQDPMWRQVETNEDLALIVGDASGDSCGWLAGTDEYNRQLAGCAVDESDDPVVILERVAATGETTQTHRAPLQKEAGGGYGDPSSLAYAELQAGNLQPGFYRVTAEVGGDRADFSYLIRYGSPFQIVNQYREDAASDLTQQAQQVRDEISSGGIETITVTTNETGYATASVPTNTALVQVQAYKAPGVNTDPSKLTYGNVTSAYEGTDITNESVYLPSKTYRVEPPADVTVRMAELTYPPQGGNLTSLQDQLQELRNQLENRSLAGATPAKMQALENETRSQLESTYQRLMGNIRANDGLRDLYLEISGRNSLPAATDLSRQELQQEIGHASAALGAYESTSPESVDTSTGGDTISVAWTAPVPDDANVTVWADYTNGTTQAVSDEHISIDRSVVGSDAVRVSEFPLGSSDPAAVSFRLTVSGSEGVVQDTTQVTNPNFDGDVPAVEALDYSTLRPGPNEQVTVRVDGNDDVRNVTSATVYGPDGSPVSTSVDGNEIRFKTAGQGQHKVRYTVANLDGQEFTAVDSVRAANSDQLEEPTIAAREGTLGAYAVVGSAFESGSVTATGSETEIVGQLRADPADTPNRVHIHAESLTPASDTIDIQLVRGEEKQSIDNHVMIYYHTDRLDSDTLLWRGDDEAITRDGETKYGEVKSKPDGSTIRTYTGSDGQVNVQVVRDPTILDRTDHRIDRFRASISLPIVGMIQPPTDTAGLPAGEQPDGGRTPGGMAGLLAPLGAALILRRWSA